MAVVQVTDATFEAEVLRSPIPVVVDLYADWCGPCKAVAPVLEALSGEHAGRVKYVKIDVERNPAIAQAFRVQSIPMFAFVRDGKVAHVEVGALDRDAFVEIVGQLTDLTAAPTPAAVETWDAKRVKQAIDQNTARAADLRAAVDHARARLPGAISLPLADAESRLDELQPRDVRWVFYARSQDGVQDFANKAAAVGIRAVVLEGGMFGWELADMPIERN